jgi:uncharacterized protein YndB with AHSA1/START domain
MLKKLSILILAALAGLLLYASTRPDEFEVQRSTLVQAPPDKVFALINDFHHWPLWSPWEKLDPAMKRTHSGAPAGTGAVYAWEGNKQVGSGRMEITQSTPPSKAVIQLDFTAPMTARNVAEFTLVPEAGGTRVTWTMRGPTPFGMKVLHVFMSMDKMVGGDFEKGLANLKSEAERT